MRRSRLLAMIGVPVFGLLFGAAALAVVSPGESPPPPEGAQPRTLTVPGFKSCGPVRSPACVGIWVNMDFYAQLTHDASVRYPEDLGLAECPPPSPDPGFAPGQEVPDEVLDSAPTCAVHPRYAVTELLMVPDSAKSFIATYGCGGTSGNVCQRRDLP
jgi:hypothetical protein